MTIASRLIKQLVILLVLILIFGGGGYGTYRVFNVPTPTPTVDPRDLLQPISVMSSGIFRIDAGDYDLFVKFRNPNTSYGSPNVRYELVFSDAFGREVIRQTRTTYILPGETKHIAETEVRLDPSITTMQVNPISADWQELSMIALEGVSVPVIDVSFSLRAEDYIYGTVTGKVYNSSNYNLDKVDVAIMLYNDRGEVIAVNDTIIRTFLALSDRGFEVSWFKEFEGDVKRVESESHTNVFENDNFIRAFGGQERFQQFF